MSLSPAEALRLYLPECTPALQTQAEAFAPSNIALCKYWGKRQAALNLPVNSSLSISLGELGTRTRLQVIDAPCDEVWLNGQQLDIDSRFVRKVSQFIDLFRSLAPAHFRVTTHNNIPTAAGLASSASGFAALTLALAGIYAIPRDGRSLSRIARMGSGSASRSLFCGFAQWHKGELDDGSDSFAEVLSEAWPDLRIGVVEITTAEKSVDSRAGMTRTTDSCLLYEKWPQQAARDLQTLRQAIAAQDFTLLGETAEHNALSMHATMIASWPPLLYWQPASIEAMQQVWQCRAQGIEVYFTMDAGPNIKLLFQQQSIEAVRVCFPTMTVVDPWHGPDPLQG
ncbi:diphosphomevalonate decarboxylase [Pokkaliibacter plantistimulans]|uniref:diphosphomevalonate decarboxylase n=1 Tax=Proteobacteria bacterium 228 TaxID=2083153 RepID=A0A2S5KXR0_9PROT|nr:diphosphomevalonate decarboxylase [Pokkaliibacter plantistimulans]PPC79299.1 diphosphomevalonate decarboxylase [Pokkaliibacter plantistimulans]